MTVAELEELLAMLPKDMAVCIRSADLVARHITGVTRNPRKRIDWPTHRALAEVMKADTVHVDDRHPPMLLLEAGHGAPMWCHAFADDVEFTVRGPWPAEPKRARR
jgi:hypothetical protein